ncbi:MAG: phosphate ABC transporter substrate-binding protein [Candidatus Hydrogenedentes bacterium]|nr:phosphate ABC transporter substrate-binding protein [Candidatus Hydrogenedentota bacterium]
MSRIRLIHALCLVALPAALFSCGPSQRGANSGSISIKGSDTMLHLVTGWAEAFMKTHPGKTVTVTGGGSGTGIAALLNGTTDICSSSRDLKEEEKEQAAKKGLKLNEHAVARDGIALVVNTGNPINELTTEQIRKIYTGEITSWAQVGGPDEKVIALSRESSSGTYLFFLEHVLNKQDFRQDALLLPATSAILESVVDSPWAIGYVGLGYAKEAAGKVKVIGVKPETSKPAVVPSAETVRSGEYSIARLLFLFTAGEESAAVKEFVEFCSTPEGLAVISETGYITVN